MIGGLLIFWLLALFLGAPVDVLVWSLIAIMVVVMFGDITKIGKHK
jgi:hypothetical protein